ncbi:MAG: nucleotidyltransferase domain-containing protein [Prevotella sp.]|nr:nucleotidyltransferase domain-containing protein [Prevotella sp.]
MIQRRECTEKQVAFKQQFRPSYSITSLGLFGSVALGENSEQSDIDIVAEVEKPTLVNMFNLREHLNDRFGRKVDAVRFRSILRPLFKLYLQRDNVYV